VDDPYRSAAGDPLLAAGQRLLRPFTAVVGAFQPGRLLIGTLFVAIVMPLGALWDRLRTGPDWSTAGGSLAATRSAVDGSPIGTFAHAADFAAGALDRALEALVTVRPGAAVDASADLFLRLPTALWSLDRPFAIVFGLLALAVAALCCGALARMAAVQIATGTRLPASDALLFAGRAWTRIMGAALLPIGLVVLLGLLLLIPGLLLRVPLLNVAAALLQGLWLAVAVLAVFILTATILVLPLLPAAVACERDDAIEAVQRCVSYLLVRPIHLLAMAALAGVGMALGYAVVTWLASAASAFAAGTVGAWTPEARQAMLEPLGAAAWPIASTEAATGESTPALGGAALATIAWWGRLLAMAVAGWVVAAVVSCATQIYLCVRESADGQDPEEIEMG